MAKPRKPRRPTMVELTDWDGELTVDLDHVPGAVCSVVEIAPGVELRLNGNGTPIDIRFEHGLGG